MLYRSLVLITVECNIQWAKHFYCREILCGRYRALFKGCHPKCWARPQEIPIMVVTFSENSNLASPEFCIFVWHCVVPSARLCLSNVTVHGRSYHNPLKGCLKAEIFQQDCHVVFIRENILKASRHEARTSLDAQNETDAQFRGRNFLSVYTHTHTHIHAHILLRTKRLEIRYSYVCKIVNYAWNHRHFQRKNSKKMFRLLSLYLAQGFTSFKYFNSRTFPLFHHT
jgi:hypothetical protein